HRNSRTGCLRSRDEAVDLARRCDQNTGYGCEAGQTAEEHDQSHREIAEELPAADEKEKGLMRLASCISVLAVLTLVCNACTGSALSSEAARSIQLPPILKAPPTMDEMKSATYSGLAESLGTVTLQDGRWTGPPSAPGAASRPVVEIAGD